MFNWAGFIVTAPKGSNRSWCRRGRRRRLARRRVAFSENLRVSSARPSAIRASPSRKRGNFQGKPVLQSWWTTLRRIIGLCGSVNYLTLRIESAPPKLERFGSKIAGTYRLSNSGGRWATVVGNQALHAGKSVAGARVGSLCPWAYSCQRPLAESESWAKLPTASRVWSVLKIGKFTKRSTRPETPFCLFVLSTWRKSSTVACWGRPSKKARCPYVKASGAGPGAPTRRGS